MSHNHTLLDLINKIKKSINVSSDAAEYISSISKVRRFTKGSILIQEEQKVNKTYFVLDGALRSYCIDKEGKEHTLQFAVKDWWISDFTAIYGNGIALLTVECLADSEVIEFNAHKLNEIYYQYPEFEEFQRKNLEQHVVSLHKRILNQLQLTAQERYNLFLEQYPNIEQHVANYHIASYLGITQQSLSRVRAEIAKK